MNISEQILAEQCPSGAFKSSLWYKNSYHTDENACITALVLKEILKRPGIVPEIVVDKALDFLQSCTSSQQNGGYNFYPSNAADRLFAVVDDADDTALITLLLLRAGRIEKRQLIRETCVLLDRYRRRENDFQAPSWIRNGVFFTWLSREKDFNVVDCCVNANVIALYAFAGLTHLSGYQEACRMISEAIDWAGRSEKKLASLSPFYASAIELYFAVEQAVSMGASALTGALAKLATLTGLPGRHPDPETAIFCSAYGHVKWYCPLLWNLRNENPG